MPTGPKGQKRPADVIGNAIRVKLLDAQGHHHRGKRGGPLPDWKRSRTSGENLFRVLFMAEALSQIGASGKPGTLHLATLCVKC
jgi:hypothetical protein